MYLAVARKLAFHIPERELCVTPARQAFRKTQSEPDGRVRSGTGMQITRARGGAWPECHTTVQEGGIAETSPRSQPTGEKFSCVSSF